MSPEFAYVLAAVRRAFSPEAPLPSREGLDWTRVRWFAERHAVVPLLHLGSGENGLAGRVREITQFDLRLSAELVNVLAALRERGVDAIPLKGPVLGARLYGDRVLRMSDDLDLAVRPADVFRIKAVLHERGYRMESVPHWPSGNAYLRSRDRQLSFSDPTETVSVDIHWTFLPPYFPSPLDEGAAWRNLRRISWHGIEIPCLSPEDLLLFLCGHSAKHYWSRLSWLCDIARLLQVEPDLDWELLFSRAGRRSTLRMVAVSLLAARAVLGVELPEPVQQRTDSRDESLRQLVTAVIEDYLPNGSSDAVSPLVSTLRGLRTLERVRDRGRYVFGLALQPTEAEFMAVQLPPALYWLYYLLRPLRLALKHSHPSR